MTVHTAYGYVKVALAFWNAGLLQTIPEKWMRRGVLHQPGCFCAVWSNGGQGNWTLGWWHWQCWIGRDLSASFFCFFPLCPQTWCEPRTVQGKKWTIALLQENRIRNLSRVLTRYDIWTQDTDRSGEIRNPSLFSYRSGSQSLNWNSPGTPLNPVLCDLMWPLLVWTNFSFRSQQKAPSTNLCLPGWNPRGAVWSETGTQQGLQPPHPHSEIGLVQQCILERGLKGILRASTFLFYLIQMKRPVSLWNHALIFSSNR